MTLAVRFHDMHPVPATISLHKEIMTGFDADPKQASTFFYDRRGAELFDLICRQPES